MCSLSYVHVYRIEYVSYRQGPYRIRIVSAADRIIPALIPSYLGNISSVPLNKLVYDLKNIILYTDGDVTSLLYTDGDVTSLLSPLY